MDPVHRVFELRGGGVGGGEADQGVSVELAAEFEEFVGAEAVVVGVAAPDDVGVHGAGIGGADAVLPFVFGGEGAAGPADEGGTEDLEGIEQVGAELAGGADVGAHHGDEVDEGRADTCSGDLYGGLLVANGAVEFEGDFLPAGGSGGER